MTGNLRQEIEHWVLLAIGKVVFLGGRKNTAY